MLRGGALRVGVFARLVAVMECRPVAVCRLESDGEFAREFSPEGELVEVLGVGLASFRTERGSLDAVFAPWGRSPNPSPGFLALSVATWCDKSSFVGVCVRWKD